MKHNRYLLILGVGIFSLTLMTTASGTVLAARPEKNLRLVKYSTIGSRHNVPPTFIGSITAIGDTSITITTKDGKKYTVDITKANVKKVGTARNVPQMQVGDSVIISGVASGDNIAANSIIDGSMKEAKKKTPAATNKTDVTFGTVSSINGSSFTIEKKERFATTTVTVDTDSHTRFKKDNQSASIESLAVGQHVTVVGLKKDNKVAAATGVNIITIAKKQEIRRPAHKTIKTTK